jgi:hypothetical protein
MTDKPHPAAIDVDGSWYLRDATGALRPIETVKATDLLIDELVRALVSEARELRERLAAFRSSVFERVGDLQALLAQDYEAPIGGAKGTITLPGFDGRAKVQIAVQDRLEFGPELQIAKAMIDECLRGWSTDSPVEIRALVDRVFDVDKEGQISHSGMFMLLRVRIEDERWKRAMDAVRDSMRTSGSRRYARFYDRAAADGAWSGIPLDIANA